VEWIGSVSLETALIGHHAVAEAAVLAVPYPKWDERPLAVVALKPGQEIPGPTSQVPRYRDI
jgi:fatty-acyl-CoA synthase